MNGPLEQLIEKYRDPEHHDYAYIYESCAEDLERVQRELLNAVDNMAIGTFTDEWNKGYAQAIADVKRLLGKP